MDYQQLNIIIKLDYQDIAYDIVNTCEMGMVYLKINKKVDLKLLFDIEEDAIACFRVCHARK